MEIIKEHIMEPMKLKSLLCTIGYVLAALSCNEQQGAIVSLLPAFPHFQFSKGVQWISLK